ncbi:hypothetical protein [Terrabacter sp. Root181]|uniref:hypothetical protein n=1 Tax=Terrabacter sp. Root181 TaxID=1736484 RepID=UPI0006F32C61|nr:hypothetical protein [Terrabacter sp. Root181]KRB47053.1 hypothetical protein ASD90_01315 [Terrabacter sp. Root181]
MTPSTLSPARPTGPSSAHTPPAYAVTPPRAQASRSASAATIDLRADSPLATSATASAPATAPASAWVSTHAASTGTRTTTDRTPLLALLAPLLLFTYGIVDWVDGLDNLDGLRGLGGLGGVAAARDQGALSVAAGVLLVLSVVGFAWLTTSLGARLRHLPLAVPTSLLAAFGAGATGAVWLGHVTGLLGYAVPSALSSGGAVLTAVALAVVLVALAVEGLLPVGSLALASLAAAIMLLPWSLSPLASLVLLIALAPLTHPAGPS